MSALWCAPDVVGYYGTVVKWDDDDDGDACPGCGGPVEWVGEVWICLNNFCNLYV